MKSKNKKNKILGFDLVAEGKDSYIGYFEGCAAICYFFIGTSNPCPNGYYFDDKKGQRWQVRNNKWMNTEDE